MLNCSFLYKMVIIVFAYVQEYKKLELTSAGLLMTAGNKLDPKSVSV